jgi:hypothetical protein
MEVPVIPVARIEFVVKDNGEAGQLEARLPKPLDGPSSQIPIFHGQDVQLMLGSDGAAMARSGIVAPVGEAADADG